MSVAKAWRLPYRATSTRSWHAFSFRSVLDWVLWVILPVETRHFWMNTHRPWSLSQKMLRGSGKHLQSRLRMTAKLAPASLQLSIAAWKPCCRSGMSERLHGIIFVRPLIRWTWIMSNHLCLTYPAHALLTLLFSNGRSHMLLLTISAESKLLKLKHSSGKLISSTASQ